PHFNVLSYYQIGYNLAKLLINLLYKVSVDYQDEAALERIPKQDVVVYLINHRSNADYVVVAYVLAYGVHVSYAVGEWARAWPLEYVFKSFGAYFVRRRFREPLYHAVLERYVRLITRNGVTQGIFPEGGLTRDGRLRSPKLAWLATARPGVLAWPKERRLPELERLAQEAMTRIGAVIPVTPVPLAAAALLSFGQTMIPRPALLERMDQLRDRLLEVNAKVVRGGARIEDVWDRAWRMLRLRRLVVSDGDSVVVLPRARPLLEYYANSIAHL